MSRSTKEWVGKTDDTPVPPRVRLRVLKKFGGRCATCTRAITPGVAWTCDHVIAMINDGENRESNLQPLCNEVCNPPKNATDVAEKSRVYVRAAAHAGIKLRSSGRSFPCGRNTPWKKRVDGSVVRR